MTQAQLHYAVASATGESVDVIAAHGFQHQRMPSQRTLRSLRNAERLLRIRQNARRKKPPVRAVEPFSAA